jgi:UDP-4-amino-4,6-dideoxy-N-acetyl-beta-L-altrosamine N-acetyltransferase
MANTLIRPARPDEVWDILGWRNAPRVRQAMLTQHEIGRAEHQAWYERQLAQPLFRQMLVEHGGSTVAVQAFFNIRSRRSAWWAFYFTDAVPDDMATMLRIWKWVELAGLAYAFDTLQLDTLYCEVLRSNTAVFNWHKRFGFVSCDPALSTNTANHDLEVLSLSRAAYIRLLTSRSGQDIASVELVAHPFDTPEFSKESNP